MLFPTTFGDGDIGVRDEQEIAAILLRGSLPFLIFQVQGSWYLFFSPPRVDRADHAVLRQLRLERMSHVMANSIGNVAQPGPCFAETDPWSEVP
jgi:hypothetical protein